MVLLVGVGPLVSSGRPMRLSHRALLPCDHSPTKAQVSCPPHDRDVEIEVAGDFEQFVVIGGHGAAPGTRQG